ncbi:hypothetical protein [Psychrobacter sp. LV10R520-6]|nr:hypothetical protein [Psychrobacter sp. LV10R520-6]
MKYRDPLSRSPIACGSINRLAIAVVLILPLWLAVAWAVALP